MKTATVERTNDLEHHQTPAASKGISRNGYTEHVTYITAAPICLCIFALCFACTKRIETRLLSTLIKRIGNFYASGDDSQALSKVGCSDNGRGCTGGYRSLFLVTDGPWGQYCNKIRAPFGPFIVLVCQ